MITLDSLTEVFQGVATLFAVHPKLAFARLALIALGIILMYLGRKGVLEALIMIPMGLGMATINAAVMFFDPLNPANEAHRIGNLFVEPQAGDRLEDNLNPIGRLYYAGSTMICIPTSLHQPVGAALGAQAGFGRLSEVIRSGGFGTVRKATETPFNMILEAKV